MQPLSPSAILKAYDRATSLAVDQYQTLTDFAQAQRIANDVTELRCARGEKVLGYKIGFTNRSIWPLYGVSRPIWSPIYDTTVTQLPGYSAQISLDRFVEPRLEPEIVIGLKATPKDDSISEILRAVDWVAHGFEVVQSHFPKWKFTAAQAHASQGLHGALLIGQRTSIQTNLQGLGQTLSTALVALCLEQSRNGVHGLNLVEQGLGSNVLDGPVQALAFLVRGLAQEGKVLAPGAIITTGTLTDAQVMSQGQRWRSHWLTKSIEKPAQPGTSDNEKIAEARLQDFLLSSLELDVV
jgi:2-keto-4-pentenoate hydratase